MSFRLPPRARRIPITRVRSVTVASMMFMIPIPPTISEIAAIRPMKSMNIRRVVLALFEQFVGDDDGDVLPGRILGLERRLNQLGCPGDVFNLVDANRDLAQLKMFAGEAAGGNFDFHVPVTLLHRRGWGCRTSLEKSWAASDPPIAAVALRGLSTPTIL